MAFASPGDRCEQSRSTVLRRPSAGLLPWRERDGRLEVLLVHPGGPFWARKDAGAWQIAKGEVEPGEGEEDAARREAGEELGIAIDAPLQPLGELVQKGGKRVTAFACPLTFDPSNLRSMTFEMEWPPRSGQKAHFPEVDAARWMAIAEAQVMMLESQRPLLVRLEAVREGM